MFEVGLQISLETYFQDYLCSQVLGWDKGQFVMTRVVYVDGKPAPLSSRDKCKVRFLKDGIAYGFETEILAIQFHPSPVMFLKYPGDLANQPVRQFKRIRTNIRGRLTDSSGKLSADATIADLSEGGCGLLAPAISGQELSPEGAYRIAFSIMDTKMNLDCSIRKLKRSGNDYIIGLEFDRVTPAVKAALKSLIELFS